MPEEERVSYSAMTGQSLFYMGEEDLQHKILAIAEEEGAERASYALKLLQSEGELTIASTGKDPVTGKLVTHTYRVDGPVMIFLTTTAIDGGRGAPEPLHRADGGRGEGANAGDPRAAAGGADARGHDREGGAAADARRCTRTRSGCLRPLRRGEPVCARSCRLRTPGRGRGATT